MPCTTNKLLIPQYAKKAARRALSLRKKQSKSKKVGLSVSQARKQGIRSGVSQAKYLISHKYLSPRKAIPYYRFYQRFKNCMTKRCEQALDLWGGRKFLKSKVFRYVKTNAKRKTKKKR